MPIVILALLLVACGEAAPQVPPTVEPASEAGHALEEAAAPSEPTAPSITIGWDHLPLDPNAAARAGNAEGLRIHGHGGGASEEQAHRVYEGSLAAFERVATENPDYLFARFNVACALARLGRHQDAVAILSQLLALDLPTFAPRLDSDPDLASLTSAPGYASLTALRTTLGTQYAEALRAGVPVVHVTPRESIPGTGDGDATLRRTFQAGMWLLDAHRFVPMGPRIVREVNEQLASITLTATFVDRDAHAVVSFEGMGSWAEGGDPIDSGTVVIYDAFQGRERARVSSGRGHDAWIRAEVHATETGLAMEYLDGDWEEAHLNRGEGSVFDEHHRPSLGIGLAHASVHLPFASPPDGITVVGDTLQRGEARVSLPPEHHMRPTEVSSNGVFWAPRDATSHWLLTGQIVHREWSDYDARAVALSEVRVGEDLLEVRLVDSVRAGIAGMARAGDGAVVVQLGERVMVLRASGPEALPDGLRLVPAVPDGYRTGEEGPTH